MGGNQSSKSSIYPTGFHKALYKHLQSYKKKTNNNNEQYEELSIFKSYLSSELQSDQVLYFVYDIFTSLDAFTKHDELSEDLYNSLLSNQLLEYDKNDINVTTLQFKEDFQLSLRNLTNELLCFDKENIIEEKKTPIKKESTKKVDIKTKKTGTIQQEYVSNNNRYLNTNSSNHSSNEKPNFKETLNTKKKQENLQNTINPKIDTINSHNNNIGFDVSGLINEQNKESFTSAQEGFDFNESNIMISKDLFNSNKKNPNYQTLHVKKTNKKTISHSSKQKANKTTQNSRKMLNNNSSYSSFRINIKDLMKESNQTSMNKNGKKENIENKKNEVNQTFLDCLDKFLDVDKSYLEKKKNQEPKQIKRRYNQYSYFNSINKTYNFTSKYNSLKSSMKKNPKKIISPSKSDYYSNLNYINGNTASNANNKITEESISNTINYGNYISTLSKENKSNTLKTSHSKDNDELDYINQEDEPKKEDNNFFTPPQDIIHDIIGNSDIHKSKENIISTLKPEEHSLEIEGIKKNEEINLTDSEGEEFYSAYSSHQSEPQKEK